MVAMETQVQDKIVTLLINVYQENIGDFSIPGDIHDVSLCLETRQIGAFSKFPLLMQVKQSNLDAFQSAVNAGKFLKARKFLAAQPVFAHRLPVCKVLILASDSGLASTLKQLSDKK